MIVKIKCALDKGEYVAYINMNISKGFDGLICKLLVYGLSSNAYTLIVSYMFQQNSELWLTTLEVVETKHIGVYHLFLTFYEWSTLFCQTCESI